MAVRMEWGEVLFAHGGGLLPTQFSLWFGSEYDSAENCSTAGAMECGVCMYNWSELWLLCVFVYENGRDGIQKWYRLQKCLQLCIQNSYSEQSGAMYALRSVELRGLFASVHSKSRHTAYCSFCVDDWPNGGFLNCDVSAREMSQCRMGCEDDHGGRWEVIRNDSIVDFWRWNQW
jgi:hypothetical protein